MSWEAVRAPSCACSAFIGKIGRAMCANVRRAAAVICWRSAALEPKGLRSWSAPGFGSQPLNGMAHGAAGFAYALAALAAVTGHEEFADAAFGMHRF